MIVDDIIAALATPPGQGAVCVLRVSGKGALALVNSVWKGRKIDEPRRASLGEILSTEGKTIDQVLAIWFAGPASYTGEEVVEISGHGGVLIAQRLLERLLQAGARLAHPGEFTQRAFLNGKLDLSQAEAVMDLISAPTDLALEAAHQQLAGRLGHRTASLREELLSILAHVEAWIDFPEEDIDPDTGAALLARMQQTRQAVEALLATADHGRLLREGARTVICGPPNVGKSSLLNRLLGFERALVSPTAGTTRDTVEEVINVRGVAVRLIDTAGVREADDSIEKAGIDRTLAAAATADLRLQVAEAHRPKAEFAAVSGRGATLTVLNKSDLGEHESWVDDPAIRLSCQEGHGLDELANAIAKTLLERSSSGQESHGGLVAINARHQACLSRAKERLIEAEQALSTQQPPEFIALDLREAMEAIGEITGRADTEELLGVIFGQFCIGK